MFGALPFLSLDIEVMPYLKNLFLLYKPQSLTMKTIILLQAFGNMLKLMCYRPAL